MKDSLFIREANYLEEAKKHFKSNPLLCTIILTGIFGVMLPFLSRFMQSNKVHVSDIEQIEKEVTKINNSYKDLLKLTGKIKEKSSYRWQLNSQEKKLLKKLAEGKSSSVVSFFSFLIWLMQAVFFVAIGILTERKISLSRFSKYFHKEKDNTAEKPKGNKSLDDINIDVVTNNKNEVKNKEIELEEKKIDDTEERPIEDIDIDIDKNKIEKIDDTEERLIDEKEQLCLKEQK